LLAITPDNLLGGLASMALLTLVVAGYGYLLVRRSDLVASSGAVERAGISFLTGFAALSWIGSILAVASLFTWWANVTAALAAVWIVNRPPPHSSRPAVTAQRTPIMDLASACLLMVGIAWLFARPSESYLLFDDSAVYTIAGIHLAYEGTLIPEVTPFLCSPYDVFRYWGPFRLWDTCASALSVGFLPVPKVWAAYATWIFGAGGTVWMGPYAGFLAMGSLLLFLRGAVGRVTSLVIVALVAVSLPQLWYGRILMSEAFTTIVLFGGLFLLGLGRERDVTEYPGLASVLGVLLLATLALVRVEALLILGIVAGAWLCARHWQPLRGVESQDNRRHGRTVVTWLAIAGLFAGALALVTSPHYFLDTLIKVVDRNTLQWVTLGGLGLLAVASMLWRSRTLRTMELLADDRQWHRIGLVLGAGLLMVMSIVTILSASRSGEATATWIVAYLGLPLTLLALGGLVLIAYRQPEPEFYAILTLTVLMSLLYAVRPMVTSVHPWAVRRLVPFIIPTYLVGAVQLLRYARELALRLWPNQTAWKVATALALSSALGLASLPLIKVSLPFVTYREAAGLWQQLVQLENLYPEDAVLIFDDGAYGTRLPQVMELAFGREVISLVEQPGADELARLEQALADLQDEGKDAYFSVVDGDMKWESPRFGLVAHASQWISAPRVVYVSDPPPAATDRGTMEFLVDIYQVVPDSGSAASIGEVFSVLPAEGSRPYLVQGFLGLEYDAAGRPFRWTSGDSVLALPLPSKFASDALMAVISLELSGWRPGNAPYPELLIEAQGISPFTIMLEGDFVPQTVHVQVPVPREFDERQLELRLSCDPWYPQDYGIEDSRALGVIFYAAAVEYKVMQ